MRHEMLVINIRLAGGAGGLIHIQRGRLRVHGFSVPITVKA